jgi:thioredoxin reductase (NADPH)
MNNSYDVIILGAGAAGLTAAIFTCRKKLKTLIVSVDVGGQTNLTYHIENYPGFYKETPDYPQGPKLMKIFEEQAKHYGAELIYGKAGHVEKLAKGFKVTLTNGEHYECKALILAYGKVPRSLGVPGEEKFIGRGVSGSATLDAHKFSGKKVAVIGGGNSAVEGAEFLTKFAQKVYLIHRRDTFRADEITVEKIKKNHKIEFVLNSAPTEIKGHHDVESVVVEDVNTKQKRDIHVNGIFVEIGYMLDTTIVKEFVETSQAGEIVVNDLCETKCPGMFAAGDITTIPYKQTITSAGHGATAGLSAYMYLMKLEGKTGVKLDWS